MLQHIEAENPGDLVQLCFHVGRLKGSEALSHLTSVIPPSPRLEMDVVEYGWTFAPYRPLTSPLAVEASAALVACGSPHGFDLFGAEELVTPSCGCLAVSKLTATARVFFRSADGRRRLPPSGPRPRSSASPPG